MKYIATISFGKDSTVMCDLLLKNGHQIDYILFNDTLMEFDLMYEYKKKVEQYFLERYGKEVITTVPNKTFEETIFGIIKTKGAERIGDIRGLPNPKPIKSYTKQDQLKRNDGLKQKVYKDPKYLSWIHNQNPSCFVCGQYNKIELHHVKEHSSDKKDDRVVIPLCGEEHHRNGKLSPHGGTKLWRETYSMDEQREYANKLYEEYRHGTD